MAFYVSPQVAVIEKDLTGIVPGVSTSYGATVGVFNWGPVNFPYEVAQEKEMSALFGSPDNATANSFFTAANFLAYTTSLKIVRAETKLMANACTTPWVTMTGTVYGTMGSNVLTGVGTFFDDQLIVGQTIRFEIDGTVQSFEVQNVVSPTSLELTSNLPASILIGSAVSFERWQKFQIFNENAYELMSEPDLDNGGTFAARYPGEIGNSISISMADKYSFNQALTGTVTVGEFQISGTLTTQDDSATIVGADTKFTEQLRVGQTVTVNAVTPFDVVVDVITDDTHFTATAIAAADATGVTATTDNGNNVLTGFGTDFVNQLVDGSILTFSIAGNVYETVVLEVFNATQVAIDVPVVETTSNITVTAKWAFADAFDTAPGTSDAAFRLNANSDDEVHIVVYDQDGLISGTPGLVLEKFAFASKAFDAKTEDGSSAYYKNVINRKSKYIWFLSHPDDASGASLDETGRQAFGQPISPTLPYYKINRPITYNLIGGAADSTNTTDGFMMAAYDLLANDEVYDVSLIPMGKVSPTVASYVIQNIAEIRKDCVAFASPYDIDTGEPIIGSTDFEIQKLIDFRNLLPSSSYGVLDSGYKYQYDRYNDIYRWVPLNGDIAGLCARTDAVADAWWSPGGFNRGQIKNVAKLAINPNKTQRDKTYKANINCVVNFPGEGPVLYGDKTLLTKPSAFDRINVRRLFIVLEKAIATAAKYYLFELNDAFTRASFKAMVEPFLRDVQGRRGMSSFHVECSEINNTPEVIDRNEFMADIYIAPARSINYVVLSFVAVRTGVRFEEIVGKA